MDVVEAAFDSGDEWLEELLAPAPPQKRRRASDDDIDALQFLDELLNSYKSDMSSAQPSLVVATLPALRVVQPSLPAPVLLDRQLDRCSAQTPASKLRLPQRLPQRLL